MHGGSELPHLGLPAPLCFPGLWAEPDPAPPAPPEHPRSASAPQCPRKQPQTSSVPPEIEFNVTGNYGSPLHVNHNANYSSIPSPDLEHGERRHDPARRPLSVATDNMMLEFCKKDG